MVQTPPSLTNAIWQCPPIWENPLSNRGQVLLGALGAKNLCKVHDALLLMALTPRSMRPGQGSNGSWKSLGLNRKKDECSVSEVRCCLSCYSPITKMSLTLSRLDRNCSCGFLRPRDRTKYSNWLLVLCRLYIP